MTDPARFLKGAELEQFLSEHGITGEVLPGVYVIKPGASWLSIREEEATLYAAPTYDLDYVTRAADSPFGGLITGDRQPRNPTIGEMTEHLPEKSRLTAASLLLDVVSSSSEEEPYNPHRYDGVFTGPFAIPGFDANGNRIKAQTSGSPNFDRIDWILERTQKIIDENKKRDS